VRRPPCDATLAVDAFKIPDEQQTEVPPRRQTRPPHSLRVEPGALLFHPFVKAALFQQSVQLFVKRMRYRPRQVCLCDPNRLLSSLPRFSAHCHARSLLPTVVNHSTIYNENPDLHHGLLEVGSSRGPALNEGRRPVTDKLWGDLLLMIGFGSGLYWFFDGFRVYREHRVLAHM